MRKVGLIAVALVLALGALGVGFAAWTDTVIIDGTVDTGEVAIAIHCPISFADTDQESPPILVTDGALQSSLDWNASAPGPGFQNSLVKTGKNVGWVTSNCESLTPPIKAVTINFHNVYPCYANHIAFSISNIGTIPVKIDHVVFTDSLGRSQTLYQTGYLVFDLSGNGVNDFELYWGDNFGVQQEPGGSWSIDFHTHFMQDEQIDFTVPHTYSLTVEVFAVQWNEYPLPPQPSP